jgi:uncharacterized protein HemY
MSIELQNLIQRAKQFPNTTGCTQLHLLESAAEENPEVMELFLTMGDIYLRRKLYEKAIFQYQKAHALSPRNHYLAYILEIAILPCMSITWHCPTMTISLKNY